MISSLGVHLHRATIWPLRSRHLHGDDALAAATVHREFLDRRELAVAVLRGGQDHALPSTMISAMTSLAVRRAGRRARPRRCGPSAARRLRRKRIALPSLVHSMMSRVPSVMATPTSWSPCVQVDGDDAGACAAARTPTASVFLTVPCAVAMKTKWSSSNSRIGSTAVMRSPSCERQQVHDRLAARAAPGLRQLVDLQPVQLAAAREAQQRVVRVGDEQLVDEILVLDRWSPPCRDRRGAAPGTPSTGCALA